MTNTDQHKRTAPAASPFQLVKLLSWSFFVLIVGFNLMLSIFLADYARHTLMKKQEEFALLLAENLNHQIFQRFTLPTLIGFGRIELRQKAQFERLDKTVRSTIHSFHVIEVRIYDFEQTVAYSTNAALVGLEGLAGHTVKAAMDTGQHSFEVINFNPTYRAFLRPELEKGSAIMRTVYTLRAERRLDTPERTGPIIGVLEFTQDITDVYSTVLNFQRIIILSSLLSSLGLFFMLLLMIRRADRLAAQRTREKEMLERDLHQSEKMASMGRMVSGIAHEIRNPLGIIRSSAELLLGKSRREDPKSSHTRILQAIFDESKRLSRTVNEFLDYARPKAPRLEPVDVTQVLDQMAVFLESKLQQQEVELAREYAPGVLIMADRDLIYRAFYNLVANALEALNGPGKIRISVNAAAGQVMVNIEDSGTGFAPETLEKLRDPFFTTKDSGTGLGLTIVDTILGGHGAQMHLGNNPEGGARVEIIFPAAKAG
ncbi:ATP-binding protein [Desulfocurvibacter africanus]|uniref:histidine kinase n=1 Tax=Desulfocurvibacter africanus subsp. africanus str. Walvis Bay TaxID=690850 RepID=F3YWD4_DESAF|nr:ATP-binding protein [Desulfocurvibacter africanus]EGJ49320.1 integral membrane sensor signal transduction histidine kinase [Desulfocurvibacter africanus subsp. africanus str. Walvis Bay]